MTFASRLNPYFTFLALTVLIGAIASTLAHSVTGPGHHALIGAAASLDLTITITFLYYWLLVRPGLRSKATMLFVALLGLWRASFLFPEIVPGRVWIGAGVELAVFTAVGAGFWKTRNAARGRDPLDRLRAAFSTFVPIPAAAGAMASECAVLYYGFHWRLHPHVPPGSRAFTMHKRTMADQLLFATAFLSLLEIVPMHLIVNHWSGIAAWVLTGLSIYGAIWMMAMARAFALRPTLVSAEGVTVRYGLLFNLRIPADRIRSIHQSPADALVVPRNTTPQMYLEFAEPLYAETVLGFRKRITGIGLSMDDPAGFEIALQTFKSARVLK